MSEWSEERRRNAAADAEQRRLDADAAAERRAKARTLEDQRRREAAIADKAAARAEQQQERRDKQARRRERISRRTEALTPANIYNRATLVVVAASIAASLPAQFVHFIGISPMLAPVPLGVEGAAWVAAAGVRYADEVKLPGWVRWMLRGICLAAASFAATINYGYGRHLAGLTGAQQQTAALGLAAVSMLGPLLFELRQWVTTIAAVTLTPKQQAEAKAREAHTKARSRHHKKLLDLSARVISAAPYGAITDEDAFQKLWGIQHGTSEYGMTRALRVRGVESRQELETALTQAGMTLEAAAVELFLADAFGPGSGDGEDGDGTGTSGREKAPRGPGGADEQATPGGPSKGRFLLGGKGKQAFSGRASQTPEKPLAEGDLTKVRNLAAAIGGAANLSHTAVKKCIGGGRNDYLVRLRKHVQSEGSTTAE